MYWYKLYKEIRLWYIYRKVAKANEEFLANNNMRVDWIGRIYTVLNMPPEVLASPEIAQEGWVFQQLPKMTKVLMEMGIAEAAFPSMEKIEGTDGFLVVLWPEFDRLAFWPIISHTFLTTLIIILAKLGFNLAEANWTAISQTVSNIWNYIF
jgi:hypothetical protein